MAAKRISMRKIKEVLRLFHTAGLSRRQIAKSLSISREAVAQTIMRAEAAGLRWPLPPELDHEALEALLYPAVETLRDKTRPSPDCNDIHRESQSLEKTGLGRCRRVILYTSKGSTPRGRGFGLATQRAAGLTDTPCC